MSGNLFTCSMQSWFFIHVHAATKIFALQSCWNWAKEDKENEVLVLPNTIDLKYVYGNNPYT